MTSAQTGRDPDLSTKVAVAGGVTRFAGIMLAVIAVFEIFQGIAAVAEDTVFVTGLDYTYELDVTTWGWVHLFLGVLCLAVGIGMAAGSTVGNLAGIGVAGIVAVANFAFLPYYPFWALLVIAFNVVVIWAACHQLGRDRLDDEALADALDNARAEGRPEGHD